MAWAKCWKTACIGGDDHEWTVAGGVYRAPAQLEYLMYAECLVWDKVTGYCEYDLGGMSLDLIRYFQFNS